ncbi:anti-sigma factor [Rudanella paleaurantiibacter]|uniref:hypothetical protein n=1 Tax=Rudanella paleaurantiibacter TaxID=2614655 RepID=UPI0016266AA6|nr:hypothetical protein [Rudanella paleaurantiibacter]
MNNQLTIDELRAYQAGQLDGPARHRVERLLLEDPFYADALEGLEALQRTGASLPRQTAQLRQALHQRIEESASEKRLFPLWVTTMAASILLMMGVALYFIFNTKPARNTTPQPPRPAEAVGGFPVEIGPSDSAVQKTVETVAALEEHTNRHADRFAYFFATNLSEPEKETFTAFLRAQASADFGGPISVRVRTRADGSVQRVEVEDGILIAEKGQKPRRDFRPSPAVKAEAEQLVRQYPNWPRKRQLILWGLGWPQPEKP